MLVARHSFDKTSTFQEKNVGREYSILGKRKAQGKANVTYWILHGSCKQKRDGKDFK